MTIQTVTTILTPAASSSLTSLDVVKAELDITDGATDVLLTGWIDRASAAVSQYCNRPFAPETLRDDLFPERDPYPWQVPGTFAPLQLSRRPVLASPVVAVSVLGEELDPDTDFVVDPADGQIIRIGTDGRPRTWASDPVSVTYRAGYDPIPLDVQDAVIRLVKARWYARKRDPLLKSEETPGVYRAEYWIDTTPGSTGAMPPDVVDLLDNYRVPVIA